MEHLGQVQLCLRWWFPPAVYLNMFLVANMDMAVCPMLSRHATHSGVHAGGMQVQMM
jgi:hypothetical protein